MILKWLAGFLQNPQIFTKIILRACSYRSKKCETRGDQYVEKEVSELNVRFLAYPDHGWAEINGLTSFM